MQRFPIVATALSARRRHRFVKAVEVLDAGVAAGAIANVSFKDAKDDLNRAFDEAWKTVISEKLVYGKKLSEVDRELYDSMYAPECHTVVAYLKRVAKSGSTSAFVTAVTAFLTEIAPLSETVAVLKDKVVKRQPKPVEDRAIYLAPAASDAAVDKVKNVLITVTEDSYDQLVAYFVKDMNATVDLYVKLDAEIKTLTDKAEIKSVRDRMRYIEQKASAYLWNVTKALADKFNAPRVRADDADAKIAAYAKARADFIRESFVYKNLKKIASILEAKGDFAEIKTVGRTVNLGGLEGIFDVTFADGASFRMKNSVVFVINSYGTCFNRFPLTFHDAVKGDGTPIKGVSEKKMNTEFVA
jgi:hypothetical protein